MKKEGILLANETNKHTLDDVMPQFLAELEANWKPETKTSGGYGYHGSSKGDYEEYPACFDVYRCEWTTKNAAFQGLVFQEIDRFLNAHKCY